jgi:hypothetical protein
MSDKKCKRCQETKTSSEFGKDSKAKDGLKSWCKSCFSVYQQDRRRRPTTQGEGVPTTPIEKNMYSL